jgi:hypothetical protein
MNRQEACQDCKQTVCWQIKRGIFMKKVATGAPIIVNGEIENCPKRKNGDEEEDIDSWFELQGKTDTLHLGS